MANKRKIIAEIQSPDEINFEYHVQVLIVGAGAILTIYLFSREILSLEDQQPYPQDLFQLHRPKVKFL